MFRDYAKIKKLRKLFMTKSMVPGNYKNEYSLKLVSRISETKAKNV